MILNNILRNNDISLYSLFLLGGSKKRIHIEDIALKCFNLEPRKFSWIKYPKIPDVAPVRFALEKLKKEENGSLVEGSSEKKRNVTNIGGWKLTSKGLDWIQNNLDRIEKILGRHKQIANRLPEDRKLKALLKSPAYQKFVTSNDNPDISYAEFTESLICTVNTEPKILNEKLEQLFSTVEKLKKSSIINYINYCKAKFNNILINK